MHRSLLLIILLPVTIICVVAAFFRLATGRLLRAGSEDTGPRFEILLQ